MELYVSSKKFSVYCNKKILNKDYFLLFPITECASCLNYNFTTDLLANFLFVKECVAFSNTFMVIKG